MRRSFFETRGGNHTFYARVLTNKLMAKLPVAPSSPSPACYKVHLASSGDSGLGVRI